MATANEYPINARVILHSLVKGAQLNGQVGVVKSMTDNGRQQVYLEEEEKTVALRPSNLRYEPRPAGSLTVKEMKAVLSANSVAKEEMTGIDKAQLASMVSEKATPEEAAEILARANAPPRKAAVARPASDNLGQQLRSEVEQMENNPEMLRQQARMLKSMDPATVRRMNPQMAGLSDQQIRLAADQMEMMASNPALIKQAAEQMKNMSPSDVERVRAMQGQAGIGSAPVPTNGQPSAVAGATGATAASSSPPVNVSEDQLKTAAQQMQNMDPAQLKQQATMMRTDPASVRRMIPQMATMTDEQIRLAADQMEMMASNPEMMKQAAEQMQNMSPSDVEELRKMQSQMGPASAVGPAAAGMGGGGGGTAAPQNVDPAAMDPSKMLESMDPAQMKKMLDILKKNPAMMKQAMASNPAMAGMSEEQLGKALDAFASMDDRQFERTMGWMKRASKVSGAVSTTWQRADGLVGGYLKQILVCIGVFVFVGLLQRFGIIPSFGGAAGKVASTTTGAGISGLQDYSDGAVPVIDEQDEFAGEF